MLATQALPAEPITILINTSPWYGGFEALVEKYEADTGNKVSIDAVPLGGLLEKARNAVRGPAGNYDIVNLSNAWVVEFYAGNYLTPLTDIDPTFSFGDNIIDADGLLYWNKDKQWPMKHGGVPMAFSPNANTHLWYYRTDQIEKPPETWDDVLKTCRSKGGEVDYSVVVRGARGNPISICVLHLHAQFWRQHREGCAERRLHGYLQQPGSEARPRALYQARKGMRSAEPRLDRSRRDDPVSRLGES
ncbi:extracellular solute-binding protein (plasmid) [Sinorhizobium meliloti]|nr:extracellular solute-binding protein [Sinorhizobium meliloti]